MSWITPGQDFMRSPEYAPFIKSLEEGEVLPRTPDRPTYQHLSYKVITLGLSTEPIILEAWDIDRIRQYFDWRRFDIRACPPDMTITLQVVRPDGVLLALWRCDRAGEALEEDWTDMPRGRPPC